MSNIIKYLKNKSYIFIILFGIIKMVIGLCIQTYSYCISAIYNLALGMTKYRAKIKNSNNTGLFIIISSLLYITYSIYVMKDHLNPHYHMYVGIMIAAITFSDIFISLIGIIKNRNSKDARTVMEKYTNLCSAIISLSLTQQAILSFTNPNDDNSFFVGIIGIGSSIISIIIGAYLVLKRNLSKQ